LLLFWSNPPYPSLPPSLALPSFPLQEQKPDVGITGIDWAEKKAEASKAAEETAEYVKVCRRGGEGGREGGKEEVEDKTLHSTPLYFLLSALGAW